MEPDVHPKSFSSGRRVGIFFSVVLSIAATVAITLMLNYLGARHFLRFSWSAEDPHRLSPMTVALLQTITNDVTVTIYYDQRKTLYDDIAGLLKEYHLRNSKISVETVDYHLDPVSAQKIKLAYSLGSADDKDLIIITCDKNTKIIPGEQLANSSVEMLPDDAQTNGSSSAQKNFLRHLVAFNGESVIDGCLLTVTSKKQYLACYVVGHSEPALDDKGPLGYAEFYSVLRGCNTYPVEISLAGSNEIPAQCSLLIIAGPVSPSFDPDECRKINKFLAIGGRLLVLFNYQAPRTGLESLLYDDWGVAVGANPVTDPDNVVTTDGPGQVGSIMVDQFSLKHDLINPLAGSRLFMISPRSVAARRLSGNNVPTVTELASTGPHGRLVGNSGAAALMGRIPLLVAVERPIGVGASQKGEARIVVAGDSTFFANSVMTSPNNANENLARLAVNWLLNETPALQNVGPRRMVEYKLTMTPREMISIRWIFLAGMPGGILLFGGLVWLRRRQ